MFGVVGGVFWALLWLASVIFFVWAVVVHLRCLNRIAIALEKNSGIESPPTPKLLLPSR